MEKDKTVARRDPLREVVDYEDLVIARDLIARGQNVVYWLRYPKPAAPLGHIRYEGTRQIATFLLPLLLMAAGVLAWGWATLWITTPLGLALGYAMDRRLQADIRKTRARDEAIDCGRYRAVQILSAHLGIPPEEITLEMVQKMAIDCVKFEKFVAQRRKEREDAENQANIARAGRQDAARSWAQRGGRTAGAAAAGVAAGSIASHADADGVIPDYALEQNIIPAVNPVSGLPMMNGPFGVDIHGNAYGTNGFDN